MHSSPIRISLLGLGRAGEFHLRSLRVIDAAILHCVYDVDYEKAQQIAAQFGCRTARDPDEAIGHESVDAVIVATPTDTHFDYVQRCIASDKPVLTEKPLGRRLQHIDTCFERASARAVPIFVAFQRRFDPSFSSLIEAVRAGRVGQLQFIRSVSRDNPVPSPDYIRSSGGIFHDCMVHDLDMIVQAVGEKPTYLSSFASSFIPEIRALGDFDNVVATLAFENGVTATIDINRRSVFGYDQRIEAFGDGGMLQAENHHITTVVHATTEGIARPPVDYSFPTRYRDAYLVELECFVRCVRGTQTVPISHDDVRTNYLLATGLEIAAREKRVVQFDEIPQHPTVTGETT